MPNKEVESRNAYMYFPTHGFWINRLLDVFTRNFLTTMRNSRQKAKPIYIKFTPDSFLAAQRASYDLRYKACEDEKQRSFFVSFIRLTSECLISMQVKLYLATPRKTVLPESSFPESKVSKNWYC